MLEDGEYLRLAGYFDTHGRFAGDAKPVFLSKPRICNYHLGVCRETGASGKRSKQLTHPQSFKWLALRAHMSHFLFMLLTKQEF